MACRTTISVVLVASEAPGGRELSDVEVSGISLTTLAGERVTAVALDCGTSLGDRPRTVCFIDGGPGTYEFDVSAPGVNPKHVTVIVPSNVPTECCPVTHVSQEVDVHLWRPLDPACVSELTGVAPQEIPAIPEPPVCEVHPDLPPMAQPAASCAELLPPRVASRTIALKDWRADVCGQPFSDGRGTFMAPMHIDALISLRPEPSAFWAGDGSWSRRTDASAAITYARVVPGPSGFVAHDLGHGMDYPGRRFAVFDTRGDETRLVTLEWSSPYGGPNWPADVASDGRGGSVLSVAAPGCADTVFGLYAQAFDASGDATTPRFPVATVSGEVFEALAPERYKLYPKRISEVVLAGVDGEGRILVTWEGTVSCGPGTIAARWFDRDGKPLTPVFRAAAEVAEPFGYAQPWRIARLMDGSLVLQTMGGGWLRRFVAPQPAAGPVPAWLAGRHDELAIVRGGRAYALVPDDSDCRPRIELRSPAGEACGVLDYPPLPRALETPCDPSRFWPAGPLHVGFDGSVARLTREAHYTLCDGANHCCDYEWWLGELR